MFALTIFRGDTRRAPIEGELGYVMVIDVFDDVQIRGNACRKGFPAEQHEPDIHIFVDVEEFPDSFSRNRKRDIGGKSVSSRRNEGERNGLGSKIQGAG